MMFRILLCGLIINACVPTRNSGCADVLHLKEAGKVKIGKAKRNLPSVMETKKELLPLEVASISPPLLGNPVSSFSEKLVEYSQMETRSDSGDSVVSRPGREKIRELIKGMNYQDTLTTEQKQSYETARNKGIISAAAGISFPFLLYGVLPILIPFMIAVSISFGIKSLKMYANTPKKRFIYFPAIGIVLSAIWIIVILVALYLALQDLYDFLNGY